VPRAFVCALSIVAAGASAHADGPRRVDEDVAFALSVGATAGAYGLGHVVDAYCDPDRCTVARRATAVALFVAPSLGHWYAEDWWTRGLGLRALGIGVYLGAVLGIGFECDDPESESGFCARQLPVLVLAGAGGGLLLWGMVDDIVTARSAARDRDTTVVAPIVSGRF
jgi:hypothetical protein